MDATTPTAAAQRGAHTDPFYVIRRLFAIHGQASARGDTAVADLALAGLRMEAQALRHELGSD